LGGGEIPNKFSKLPERLACPVEGKKEKRNDRNEENAGAELQGRTKRNVFQKG